MTSILIRALRRTWRARTAAVVALTITGTLAVGALVAPPASAAGSGVLYVAQGGADAGDCSVETSPCATVSYALTQGASGATINVSGTIHDNVSVPYSVTITGANAPVGSPAVIDGSGAGTVVVNPNFALALDHLTIRDGNGNNGGGIANFGTLTLTKSLVTGNVANSGGGVFSWQGSATIVDSTISDNLANACGTCNGDGGGIYFDNGNGPLSITGSTISGNQVTGYGDGGGIWGVTCNRDTITRSTVSGNVAYDGGGIWGGSSCATGFTITASTVTGNKAVSGGGGIFDPGYVVTLLSSTVTGNSGPAAGDVENNFGTVYAGGSIVGPMCGGGTPNYWPSWGYNLDPGTVCTFTGPTDVGGVDPHLGPLQDNGGPTQTMLPAVTSPAIDTIPVGATLNGVPACPRTDQRGVAGPFGTMTGCTIGAVEASSAQNLTQAPLAVTSTSGLVGTPRPLSTGGGSGVGAVTYTLDSGPCTLSSAAPYTLSRSSAGPCTVTATKAADANYLPVSSPPQDVTFTVPVIVTSTSGTYLTPLTLATSGGSGTGAVTFAATDGTATGCTVSDTAPFTLSTTSAGTCIVTANKAADSDYPAASSAPATVTLAKSAQPTLTITSTAGPYLTPLTLTTSGGSGIGAVTFTATDGTATGCAVSDTAPYTLSTTSSGTCVVTAAKAGDGNYLPAATIPTTITLHGQATLTVTSLAGPGPAGTPLTLTTSGGSGGGAVSYVTSDGSASGCQVSGAMLVATTLGTCIVTATKAGDGTYGPISSAAATVTFATRPPAPPLGVALSRTTTVSGLVTPAGVAVDTAGDLFVAEQHSNAVVEIRPDGTRSDIGSGFNLPSGVAVDPSGNVYVADTGNHRVQEITPGGIQFTLGHGFSSPTGIAVDQSGNVYVTDTDVNNVSEITPSGSQFTIGHNFAAPYAIAVDHAGNVFVTDILYNAIFVLPTSGSLYTVNTGFKALGIAVDRSGNLYVTDSYHGRLVEITSGGQTQIGGAFGLPADLAVDGSGDVYLTDYNAGDLDELVNAPSATTAGPGAASVTWTRPLSDGGATITGYTVTAADSTTPGNGGQTCSDPVSQPEADTCTVTGLTGGDNYTFTVTATNEAGTSAPSVPTGVLNAAASKATQAVLTITSATGTYGSPLSLTTSGGSGTGAVGFVAADGTATGCTVTGSTLSSTSAGTCTVTATKAGDDHYLPVSSIPTTVTLHPAPIVVTVTGSQVYGAAPPTFHSSAQLPTGVTISGSVNCGKVDDGTAITASLPGGKYTIDGSSCTGLTLSSSNYAVSYTGGAFTVAPATSGLLYTGGQTVVMGSGFTAAAALSSTVGACAAGQPVTFAVDSDPTGATTVSTYPLGTATTDGSGTASLPTSTTGWQDGVYTITATYAGTASCAGSADQATLTVAAAGDAATGGGWYTLAGSGRVNFGLAVHQAPHSKPVAYTGQFVLINTDKWRLKGTVNSYVAVGGSGSVSGTGTLSWWNPALDGGLGDWQVAASGVSFSASFTATSGAKHSNDPGTMGVHIDDRPVAPQPTTLPNSSPQALKGGHISVS